MNDQAIAVIGLAGRFPGAPDVSTFWRNLRDSVESVTELTPEELVANGADPKLVEHEKYVRKVVLLDGIDQFDAGFFGYSPTDAALLDPQHRLFLECAWHALEDAACDPRRLDGRIGVYAGSSMSSYLIANLLNGQALRGDAAGFELIVANDKDYLASRVSYKLDLDGPAVSVQTACSSSLTAIHQAAQALLSFECDVALAGGSTVRLPQGAGFLHEEGMILSPDGHCRPFDAAAGGTTIGSGAGVVVLKRLEDAVADRDRIDAVLLGSAVNNDGAGKVGYTAPSVDGQARVVAAALAAAEVTPDTVAAVETHGTGTQLGDPIEIAALSKVFRTPCVLGSVKSNIGHLDSAAGVASFVKAVLQLRHGELVPSLNFAEPNPEIDFGAFEVATATTGWKANGTPRRIGVSSFGFGGTNVHAVLEEAPAAPEPGPKRPLQVLTISAHTKQALEEHAKAITEAIEDPDDAARTLQTGRAALKHRRAIVGEHVFERRAGTEPRVHWLFPGQGSQYAGMGYLDSPYDEMDDDTLRQTGNAQPALFLVQTAVATQLREWGLAPDGMLGHSIGEITAAHLAGVFSFEDALEFVTLRGKLMQQQPPGGMATVQLSEEDIDLPDGLALAAINAPELCVVSGPHDLLDEFLKTHEGRKLHTSHAFHSPMMRPVLAPLTEALRGMRLNPPTIPFISNRTGTWITDEQATDPEYWAGHVLDPVRFAEGVGHLDGVLLEVGPGHTLTSLAKAGNRDAITVTTLRAPNEDTDDATGLAIALGKLWLAGVEIDWEAVDDHAPRNRVSLPGLPFQRKRYWAVGGELELPAETESEDAEGNRPDLDSPFVAPRNETERALARIWSDLLGVHPIGVHDSFLELGGHSLLALKVVKRITADLGVTIPLRRLVRAGTIAKLADLTGELGAEPVREQTDQVPQAPARPEEAFEPFPLTEIQQAQWIGRMGNFQLGNVAAHIYFEVDSTTIEVDRLQQAWYAVEARHPMLHAIVTPDGTQRVLPDVGPYEFPTVDLREATPEQAETELAAIRERLEQEMRPADTWPLFEIIPVLLPDGRVRVHLSFDLLIADIGSIRILLRDWNRAYQDIELPPVGVSYRDYVLASREVRESDLHERSLAYWRERVKELPPAPRLPLARNPAEIDRPVFVPRGRLLPQDIWQRLIDRGAHHGITPSAILLAAYGAVLGTWCRHGQLTMNITMINRLPVHPDVDELVGEFASFDLLPIDLTSGATFAELAMALQEQGWDDLEHRYVNGVEVLRELARVRGGTSGGVMPVVFTSTLVQQAEPGEESMLGWMGEIVQEGVQTPQVWLDAAAMQMPDGLYLSWPGVEALFPDGLLDEMFDAYLRMLVDLAESEQGWVEPPRSLMPDAQVQLVKAVNDTGAMVPAGLLPDGILAQDPERIAIVAQDATLTFGQLIGCASAVARKLRPHELVGVSLPKGAAQVVAALGVLLAGSAYLPIDPDLPEQRREALARKGECRTVITSVDLTETAELPDPAGTQDDLAYVIFTSGSTGEPKGVAVTHRAALNTCVDVNERFGVGPHDKVLGLSSLSFDLSVWDVFGVLGAGGTLVLPEPEARRDPARWLELVWEHGITVWNSVPALAKMFAEHVSEPVPLRLALLSGDWIPLDLPDQLRALAPDCRVISLGGATEAAIWSICHEIGEVDPAWESIPYGRPMRNQWFHVLNDRWQECPVHVEGELFIGGVGLAQGYFDDPERTAAQFVRHPVTGERLYRTGDLGRWRPDGRIEFLGREDFQVKIGGYRIELGEIETALADHPEVGGAVVNAVGDRHHRRLVAYLVCDEVPADVEEFLRGRLPAYMVPATYVALEEFPLTGNGKLDRSALPDPTRRANPEAARRLDDPDGVAARLSRIVAEAVGLAEVDPYTSFFELGGDSITGVQIVSRATNEGIQLSLQDLFELQTIDQVAVALEARGVTTTGASTPLTPYQVEALETRAAIQVVTEACDDPEGLVRKHFTEHPALRTRFHREAGEWRQSVVDDIPGLARVDLTSLPAARRDRAFTAMLAELTEELDPVDGPVAKAVLFDGDRLVWTVLEAVADEASVACLTGSAIGTDARLAEAAQRFLVTPAELCVAAAASVRPGVIRIEYRAGEGIGQFTETRVVRAEDPDLAAIREAFRHPLDDGSGVVRRADDQPGVVPRTDDQPGVVPRTDDQPGVVLRLSGVLPQEGFGLEVIGGEHADEITRVLGEIVESCLATDFPLAGLDDDELAAVLDNLEA